MAIQLFQAITSAIKKAAASIAGLTNNATPKAENGELVDSPLTWDGNKAIFPDNLEVQKIVILSAVTELGEADEQWIGTFDNSVVINAQTGKSVILAINSASVLSILAGGMSLNGTLETNNAVTFTGLKSGTTQGAAGAAVNELWHDTNNNQIKIGV